MRRFCSSYQSSWIQHLDPVCDFSFLLMGTLVGSSGNGSSRWLPSSNKGLVSLLWFDLGPGTITGLLGSELNASNLTKQQQQQKLVSNHIKASLLGRSGINLLYSILMALFFPHLLEGIRHWKWKNPQLHILEFWFTEGNMHIIIPATQRG